jgi:sulfur carrier protein ThiS
MKRGVPGSTVKCGPPLHLPERMKVTATILPTRKETVSVELGEGGTVEDLMRALSYLPDGWIAVKGDRPVPSDEVLSDGDEVKLFSVVSGG